MKEAAYFSETSASIYQRTPGHVMGLGQLIAMKRKAPYCTNIGTLQLFSL
jgi:hypothetical protein